MDDQSQHVHQLQLHTHTYTHTHTHIGRATQRQQRERKLNLQRERARARQVHMRRGAVRDERQTDGEQSEGGRVARSPGSGVNANGMHVEYNLNWPMISFFAVLHVVSYPLMRHVMRLSPFSKTMRCRSDV